jgi:hemerythrin-like domain-containing protein
MLDAIDILINEHVYIKKVLSAIENDCEQLVEGKDISIGFYRDVIDFVRNFADKYHHKKEEKRLFNVMGEKDENLRNGPIMGMMLEHDIGRNYIRNLEQALNEYENGNKKKKAHIIANALSYVIMLQKHIEKEDTTIYMVARRSIDNETQKAMAEEFEEIETDQDNTRTREKYISFANSLGSHV